MENLQDKIIELMDLFDGEVTTLDKINPPEPRKDVQDIEAINRFMRDNPPGKADGGRIGFDNGGEALKQKNLQKDYAKYGKDKLEEVKIVKMELGSPDESGRRKLEIKDNSEEILKADLVIEALGFEPEDLPVMFNEPALNVTQWGTLKVDYKNLMTSLEGVFAAGDIVRGASLVVWGIRDGRDAAEQMDKYIQAEQRGEIRAAE